MSFRAYIILMIVGTLVAWLGWGIVVWNVNADEAGGLGFGLFFLTLLMGLVGTITLIGLLIRLVVMKRRELVIREVKTSFRHAVLLSGVSIISLILSAQGWLSWWVIIVFIVVAGVLEYVSLLIQHSRRG
jgi:hypothetical protein